MSSTASVEGGESLRLFFGLVLPRHVGAVLERWQSDTFGQLSGVRPVHADNLHVTLAFLGQRPSCQVPSLGEALREAARGIGRPVLTPIGYRELLRVAILVLADERNLAGTLQHRLVGLLEELGGYRRERRPWLPHVTVARQRARPGLSPDLPPVGAFSPSDAALYHSVLRPDGAQYSIVEAVALGG